MNKITLVTESSMRNNIVSYNQEIFNPVVWVYKQKNQINY